MGVWQLGHIDDWEKLFNPQLSQCRCFASLSFVPKTSQKDVMAKYRDTVYFLTADGLKRLCEGKLYSRKGGCIHVIQ